MRCVPISCANIAGDGDAVDVIDLLALLAGFGGDDASTDINGDGATDVADLLLLLAQFNGSCAAGGGGDAAGECVFTFVNENKAMHAAEDYCVENFGGHLASAHSQADGDAFATLVTGNTAWIGYHDMGFEAGCTDDRHEGIGGEIASATFVWTDASPSDYENWAGGEPNDWQDGVARCDGTGNEDCTEAWRGGDNWNDANCDGQKPFICGSCPTRATNPIAYSYFGDAKPIWEAEFQCITLGGHLASLHSQEDQDLVADMVLGTAWIGYHDRFEEAGCTDDRHQGIGGEIAATSFIWTDGTASDYENWAGGEPNDWQDGVARCDGTGNEDCTEMWRGGQDWNDAICTAGKAFICGFQATVAVGRGGCNEQGACNYDIAALTNDGTCEFPDAGRTCSGDPLYIGGLISFFPEPTVLEAGDAIGVVNLPLDFSVGFDFTPTAAAGGWANIIHFTIGGNCCGYGQRIPGVWFYGGTTRLHIRDGSQANGNHGCDPEEQIPIGETTSVRIDMTSEGVEVFYNAVSKCTAEGRDRTNFDDIQIFAADPWHETAAGSISMLQIVAMDSGDVLIPGAVYLTANPMALSLDNEMRPVNLPLDYTVGMSITPAGAVGGWGNIIHVSATGNNCCNYGDRIPAVWFYPGNLRLHIRDGTTSSGNAGCDPEEQLPIGEATVLRLEIRGFQIQVFYNDELKCEAARVDGRVLHANARVWMADPWHDVANAIIDDAYILPLAATPGCVTRGACNFDPTSSEDDGSCEMPAEGVDCNGDPLYADGVITMFPEARQIENGDPIAVINLPLDFSVQFDVTPAGSVGGWGNIIHFTADGGNCCGYGQRIPGIWFYPGNLRLHIRDGSSANGNDGCDPEEELPVGETTNVRVQMTSAGVEVMYNGISKCTSDSRDRTNFDGVMVYSSDPWHTAADATIQMLQVISMDSSDDLVAGATYFTASPFQLVNGDGSVGREMASIDIPLDFDLSFVVNPAGSVGGWGNIIHITADGGNCCNYGQRIPAVWFYPGNLRLHIRDGSTANGNDGCDPEEQLPIGEDTTVRLEVRANNLEVFYNDESKCIGARAERTTFANARVFMPDPWHDAADATIDDAYLKQIFTSEDLACEFSYVETSLTMAAAEDYCVENFGGHLASAHSQADGDAFEAMVTGNTAWIGYHDMGFEAGCTDDRHQGIGGEIASATFVWTDASPSDYENWAGGEPNDWQDGVARATALATRTAPRRGTAVRTGTTLTATARSRSSAARAPPARPTRSPTRTSATPSRSGRPSSSASRWAATLRPCTARTTRTSTPR